MNSRLQALVRAVSPTGILGRKNRRNRGSKIVMKGWRQKVSNNDKPCLSTSYNCSASSSNNTKCVSSNRKISKKRSGNRISSCFDFNRLLSPLQLLLKGKQATNNLKLECVENLSAFSTPTPSVHVKQELVSTHSDISPSLNEIAIVLPTATPTQREEQVTEIIGENAFALQHFEKESQMNESVDESVELVLSQDNMISDSEEETTPFYPEESSLVMEDDGQDSSFITTQEVSDNFQLFSDNISRELFNCPTPDYLSNHPNVKPHFRRTIVDWLNTVCSEFQLAKEILYHAICLFDRSLYKFHLDQYYQIDSSNLQALASACFLISTKYHGSSVMLTDILPPHLPVQDSKEQVLEMESWVLNSLDFELRSISTIDYIALFIDSLMNDQNFTQAFPNMVEAQRFVNCMELVANYLCEIQLHNYDMLWFRSSLVALCCLILTFQMISPQSNYKSVPIIRELIKIYITQIVNDEQDGESNSQHTCLETEVKELNNCMKKCFNSMIELEQLNVRNLHKNKDPLYTIARYQQDVANFASHEVHWIDLSIQDFERW